MKHFKYSVLLGLTIFAIMFGAGNIILPPIVGYYAGEKYIPAILAFVLTSAGFAAIGVCSMALQKNNFLDITRKIHPKAHLFLLTAVVIIIGPLFAGPRTAIITHELFVTQIFQTDSIILTILSPLLFFGITLLVLMKGASLVDIIGKFLTPILLVLLIILIGGSIFSGNPFVESSVTVDMSIIKGAETGYFTVDALGYIIIATISIKTILTEKSMPHEAKTRVLINSVLIAIFLIAIVYLGLGYMGATSSLVISGTEEPNGIEILKHSIHSIFGQTGIIIFGFAVALACLTTSIGLLANTSNFFATNTKTNQRYWMYFFAVFSFVMSLLPLDNLTTFIGPVLLMLVPPSMCIAFLGLINRKIRRRRTIMIPFVLSVIFGILDMLKTRVAWIDNFLHNLPLSEYGLPWLGIVLGSIIFMMAVELVTENNSVYEDYTEEYSSLKATE